MPSLDSSSHTAPIGRNTWATSKLTFAPWRPGTSATLRAPPIAIIAATTNQPAARAPASVPFGEKNEASTIAAATGWARRTER